MSGDPFELSMVWAILPEIGILLVGVLVLVFDLAWRGDQRRSLGWLAAAGLLVTAAATAILALPGDEPRMIFGGMLRHDWLRYIFSLVFLVGAALTALFAIDSEGLGKRGEFFLLLLASTMGMCLMAGAADLVMLFLAIETTSIPLYALTGFLTRDNKSTEAGFKYFLFGAATSAVLLYGLSLVYGFTGTTQIYAIAGQAAPVAVPVFAFLTAVLLVLVGFSFKTSFFPFHFWAPDAYEGAPTPVAGFLSTASKAAGFAVLMRVMLAVLPVTLAQESGQPAGLAPYLTVALAIIASLTMLTGNILALTQKNIKRLLAYSSIAQAGYMVIGVTAAVGSAGGGLPGTPEFGIASAAFYLIAYLATNLAAFGVVTVVGRAVGGDDISCYAGLSRRSPGLALVLLVAFLSLAGIPPFGGFVAKVFVFGAAIQANLVWLAVLGIINSVIALYYYLTVVKVVYLYRSSEEEQPVGLTRAWSIALTVCVAGIILLGTLFGPWFTWSQSAAAGLF